jgi:thiol-disulfide isomerase/thioredoxin
MGAPAAPTRRGRPLPRQFLQRKKGKSMNMPRLMLTVLLIGVLPGSRALSQDKPGSRLTTARESFKTVKDEYDDASKAWTAGYRAARDEARKKGQDPQNFESDKPHPAVLFSPRFLSVAEKDPEAPDAIDALRMTLLTSNDPKVGRSLETRAKAVKILHAYYVDKPSIKGLLRFLALYDDQGSRALVADVIARNPDRTVQLAAYKGQVTHCEILTRFAESVKDAKRLEMVEKQAGKEFVKERLTQAELAHRQLDQLKQTIRDKYGDLVNDLSNGKAAPEIKMQAVDGTEARLSALKGKVVVLDIWTTWCGPCKAMIPHEREMVERLKDKPFVLVSISADEKKETLTAFLAQEKMPWTHWWNGQEGGIMDEWNVKYFPTTYVIDTLGVIRHKDLRGEELEKAVNALLTEKPDA